MRTFCECQWLLAPKIHGHLCFFFFLNFCLFVARGSKYIFRFVFCLFVAKLQEPFAYRCWSLIGQAKCQLWPENGSQSFVKNPVKNTISIEMTRFWVQSAHNAHYTSSCTVHIYYMLSMMMLFCFLCTVDFRTRSWYQYYYITHCFLSMITRCGIIGTLDHMCAICNMIIIHNNININITGTSYFWSLACLRNEPLLLTCTTNTTQTNFGLT